jgi:hypothetical protein
MKSEGFSLNRRIRRTAREAGGADGIYAAHIELLDHGPKDGPAHVRPVVADAMFDWMPPIEAALAAEPGARIGVTGSDRTLAARVACEAAGWIAERGKRVVVIDGSIDDPALPKALPEDGDEGLVDVVLFGVSPSVAVRRTLAPGVFVMTTGSHPGSVSAVFGSDAFPRVISELSADSVVLIVLPTGFLPYALGGLTTVLAVERTVGKLDAVASLLSEVALFARPRAIAVLVSEAAEEGAPSPGVHADTTKAAGAGERELGPGEIGAAPDLGEGTALRGGSAPEFSPAPTTDDAELEEDGFAPSTDFEYREIILGAGDGKRPRRRWALAVLLLALALSAVGAWRLVERNRLTADERARSPEATAAKPTATAPKPDVTQAGQAAQDTEWTAGQGETIPGTESGVERAVAVRETTPAAPAHGPIAGAGGSYVLFLSSHRSEAAAETDARAALSLGVDSQVIPTEVGDTGTWYRVAVRGGYPTLGEARSVLKVVKNLGYGGAWIERSREGQ